MIPGEVILQEGSIELNAGRKTATIIVTNLGDRPVQVGSHFHFFEVNRCLCFNRAKAFGMRLDIPSGTSERFEPGEIKTVQLVAFHGRCRAIGLNGLTMGPTGSIDLLVALRKAKERGFNMEDEVQ